MPTRRALPAPLDRVFAWLRLHAPRAAEAVSLAWTEDGEMGEALLRGLLPLYRGHQRAERARRKVEAV